MLHCLLYQSRKSPKARPPKKRKPLPTRKGNGFLIGENY